MARDGGRRAPRPTVRKWDRGFPEPVRRGAADVGPRRLVLPFRIGRARRAANRPMEGTNDIELSTGTNLGPVTAGRRFLQPFVAREDNLAGISVWAATYHGQIASAATLRLLDEGRERVLREVVLDTSAFLDNTWQRFGFDPVPDSRQRPFWFSFETDGAPGAAITLWTNAGAAPRALGDGAERDDAICFKSHYVPNAADVLDALLADHSPRASELPDAARRRLHEIVRYCVGRKEYFLLRLLHMLDAFGRTRGVRRVLSVGCGQGLQESFLAHRFPALEVDALDLHAPEERFDAPNLRFVEGDILELPGPGDYDLVVSIETLEHIEAYRAAFANMAAKVAPGGYLYLSVPFASKREQADEMLRALAWDACRHYTPGFDVEELTGLFREGGLEVLHAASMFTTSLAHPLNRLLHQMEASAIDAAIGDVLALFMNDLTRAPVESWMEAEGVRLLGRRRAAKDGTDDTGDTDQNEKF